MVLCTFWAFFHKLVWSPWLPTSFRTLPVFCQLRQKFKVNAHVINLFAIGDNEVTKNLAFLTTAKKSSSVLILC
jgi:thiol-disulfide isomerase/thioredoxin